ncbi:hypothetical protein HMPREF3156_02543 [Neisseria sp. HMSC06F02]|nr:hypothetical protein HMPREF3156_02543 [Neisseria sp. HMSC06F02]
MIWKGRLKTWIWVFRRPFVVAYDFPDILEILEMAETSETWISFWQ